MSELNALFEQILHSERDFKARIDKLRELGLRVQQCQLEADHVREKAHSLQGELAVKRSTLAGLEARGKLSSVRRAVLDAQKEALTETKRRLFAELEVINGTNEADRQAFLDELKEFGQSYDLQGAGCKYRQNQAEKKISLRRDEIILLEAELSEMEEQREEVRRLEEQLREAEVMVKQERDKKDELQTSMKECDEAMKQLERDKNDITHKFSNDPEFIRLQQELEACRNCPEELSCRHLKLELEQLQRQCYQKQMQSQRTLQQRRHGGTSARTPKPSSAGGNSSNKRDSFRLQKISSTSTSLQSYRDHLSSSGTSSHEKQSLDNVVKDSTQGRESIGNDSFDSECGVNLVDDEWLMDEEEEEEEEEGRIDRVAGTNAQQESDWNADLDESELASFESEFCAEDDAGDCLIVERVNSSTSSRVAGRTLSGRRPELEGVATHQISKPLHGRPIPKPAPPGNSRAAPVFSNGGHSSASLSSDTTLDKPHTNRPDKLHQQSSTALIPNMDRGTTPSANSSYSFRSTATREGKRTQQGRSAALVVDSPEPLSCGLRKRPGDSIYKHPGQQCSRIPKTAKRVRFHY